MYAKAKMYFVTFTIFFTVISFAYSLPLQTSTGVSTNTFQFGCEPGEKTCSKCYDVLVNEIISSDWNRFNLQRAFFPPDTSNPVLVAVTYYFTRNMSGDGTTNYSLTSPNRTWFWTQSTFYLFQPIQSLQYTSLLFSDTSLRETNLSLYLQPDCLNIDNIDMIKLLTQRLKLYAMQQEILSPITDSYSAKGENLATLTMFHRGENPAIMQSEHFTNYGFAFQVVFPVVVWFFFAWLIQHLIENDATDFFAKLRKNLKNPAQNDNKDEYKDGIDKATVSTRNMDILILIICSITFVLYVISLDILAIVNRNTEISGEIFYNLNRNRSKYDDAFILEYSVTFVILIYDFIILSIVLTGLICRRCGLKRKWYHVGVAPFSCIVVHSYHIMIGFIQSPHHALSVLIFYAIVVVVFYLSLKAAYFNLFHIYQKLTLDEWSKCAVCLCCCRKQCKNKQTKDICKHIWSWNCCTRQRDKYKEYEQSDINSCNQSCFIGWLFCWCCKCENSKYSCCKIFSCFTYDKNEYCSAYNLPHPIVITIMSIIAFFLAWFMVFVVALFVIIPINMAIDEAPARLLSINQTILIFIGAAITYKLYRINKNSSNIVERLVKANKEYLKETVHYGVNACKEWDDLEAADKEVEMGKLIISALHSQTLLPSPARAQTQAFAQVLTKVCPFAKIQAVSDVLLANFDMHPLTEALAQALDVVKSQAQILATEVRSQISQASQAQAKENKFLALVTTQVQAQAQVEALQLAQGLDKIQVQAQALIDVVHIKLLPQPRLEHPTPVLLQGPPAQALGVALTQVKQAAKNLVASLVSIHHHPPLLLTPIQTDFYQVIDQVQAQAQALVYVLDPAQALDGTADHMEMTNTL